MKHKLGTTTATGKTTTQNTIGRLVIASVFALSLAGCGSSEAAPVPSPYSSSSSQTGSGGVLSPNYVAPTPAVEASPAPTETAPVVAPEVAPSSAGLLSVPGLGVSANLLSMPISNGEINPPTHSDAYIIEGTGWGKPGNDAGLTSAIAFHSWRDGEALGNSFINVETGLSTLNAGDSFSADGFDYKVEKVLYILKGDLPATDEVFETKSGRLLLITCLARPAGKSLNNVIVIAQRQ